MLAATLICLIVGISDGDTLTARCPTQDTSSAYQQIKVRLQGIDAPERRQPLGTQARTALSDLAYMKEAELHCNKIDSYQRHVCSVWVKPNEAPGPNRTLDVGLAMVTMGMAWWYQHFSHEQSIQERGQYEFAEQEARARRLGVWSTPSPTAPWDWRKSKQ